MFTLLKYVNLMLISTFQIHVVWVIGSTYRKGEILRQSWNVNRPFLTVITQGSNGPRRDTLWVTHAILVIA